MNKNSLKDLMNFFGNNGMPCGAREFSLFWQSIPDDETDSMKTKNYYLNVDLTMAGDAK